MDWITLSTFVAGVVTPIDNFFWIKNELIEYNWNSKDVHAIFIVIFPKKFKCMSI